MSYIILWCRENWRKLQQGKGKLIGLNSRKLLLLEEKVRKTDKMNFLLKEK
jgi:hypothetical protein